MYKNLIEKFDGNNLFKVISNFPNQITEAVKIAKVFEINSIKKEKVKNIVISGLGGSAIGGDLIRTFLKDKINLPIIINRDYFLPSFVNENSLIIISSYSGKTEETLSVYHDAIEKKAQIISISNGGEVRKIAETHKHQVILLPKGFQPRFALGFMFFSMLYILIKLDFIKEPIDEIEKVIELLKSRSDSFSIPDNSNPTVNLAKNLKDKFVFIYSSPGLEAVGLRFRGQLNENSKIIASTHFFPELNHNEIVAWTKSAGLGDALKSSAVILLKDKDDYSRNKYRIKITKDIIKSCTESVFELEGKGGTFLIRMFDLIYFIDWVTFYLAMLNNVDPAEIKNIHYLKEELSNRK